MIHDPSFLHVPPSPCDTTSHHRLITSIHKETIKKITNTCHVLVRPLPNLDLSRNNSGWMLRIINKLKVFNISIMTFYIKKKKTVHDKYNQSFRGERGGQGDMRGFQNEHFGGISKTPGQSPQTKLLIYTTSSKLSKKSLLKTYKEKNRKTVTTTTRGEKNGWPQKVHNHINTVTFLIT